MSYQRTPQEMVCSNCGKPHRIFRISYVQTQYDGVQEQWNFDNVEPAPCDNYKPIEVGRTQQDTWGDDDGIIKW